MSEKFDKNIIVYHDIFPHVKVEKGNAAASHWTLERAYSSYLATSPGGTATGFGSTITILDDLVKSAEEACNEVALEKTFEWICNTMISRLEKGGKLACIMTSWSSMDASRKILDWCKKENVPHKHIMMKAYDSKTNTYLCNDLLDEKTYNMKKSIIGEHIFEANYNQVCLDFEGRLYQSLKTYEKIPNFDIIAAYTDTSDTGQDYFCTVFFAIANNEAYVLDVIYTQKPMTYTEPLLAKKLYENKVNICIIESNNGGGYFAKTVEKTLANDYRSNQTRIKSFHQSKNKMARILSNSMWVQDHIYFPEGWNKMWPDFYSDTIRYIPNESAHDDNVDVLSGVSEFVNSYNRNNYNDSLYEKGKNVIGLNEYYDRYRTVKNVW